MRPYLFIGLLSLFYRHVNVYAPGLERVYSLDRATQGISISANSRTFLSQRYSTTAAPHIVKLLADNSTKLYPDTTWNSYNSSDSTSDSYRTFVSVDGARIGPDGRYWVVDGGSPGLNGSTRLVGVNLTKDTVDKLCYLDEIKASDSGIDDVRFSASGKIA
ncbi:hypothetical protein VI817_004815 [Penicillium citrinum]|nr:hypothetical protein VI817_004815 [Penicillium citrinum]